MAVPLARPKIVKKQTNKFKRHQSDRFATVKESWRRPKGIDSRVRRKFKGKTLMPNIGYGSNKKTKHVLPSGFKKFVINNVADLELLLMYNRTYAAEVRNANSPLTKPFLARRASDTVHRVLRNIQQACRCGERAVKREQSAGDGRKCGRSKGDPVRSHRWQGASRVDGAGQSLAKGVASFLGERRVAVLGSGAVGVVMLRWKQSRT